MSSKSHGRSTIWIIILLVALLLVVLGFLRFSSFYRSMSVTAAQTTELNSATPGSVVKLAIEVAGPPSADTFRGKVLTKKTEQIYARTNEEASVHWSGQTKMVMGKASDVHAGAVVHVTGKVRGDHTIDAGQIVILTGYVKIE